MRESRLFWINGFELMNLPCQQIAFVPLLDSKLKLFQFQITAWIRSHFDLISGTLVDKKPFVLFGEIITRKRMRSYG